jgi:Methane oxygenase PmoA
MVKRFAILALNFAALGGSAQENVRLNKSGDHIDVFIGGRSFTTFIFSDSLAKPVLYPVIASSGTEVTRGFPIHPRAGEPTDHPHHVGIWFNFENVNGLDFWNNSYAIPTDKKSRYGLIKTNRTVLFRSGKVGELTYTAAWVNQQGDTLIIENTLLNFSGGPHRRVIDRKTTLTGRQTVLLKDAKDGLYAIRVARELQLPDSAERSYLDAHGIETKVAANIASSGNYRTSEGKTGDAVWSTRARWCSLYGKLRQDSISIQIIDHPKNVNYPTFWHARGYGLFAANPLADAVFTNNAHQTNLTLSKDKSVVFRYRIIVSDGQQLPGSKALDDEADKFAKTR